MADVDAINATVNELHKQVQEFDLTWWTWGGMPLDEAARRLETIRGTVHALLAGIKAGDRGGTPQVATVEPYGAGVTAPAG